MKQVLLLFAFLMAVPLTAWAESQGERHQGVGDPFGGPGTYEFADDEKADKEFFHLGRFLMIGFDVGGNIYTGGLGSTITPNVYFGARLLYFFDRSLAFEAAGHYANQLDVISNGSLIATIDTTTMPLTLGFRFYFDVRNSPRAIALANPYLAFGGGAYLRQRLVLSDSSSTLTQSSNDSQFGAYAAVGLEFDIYRRHLYLGVDLRYHLVFFFDEDDTFGGLVNSGDRAGDLFTPVLSITYNF